MRFSGSLAFSIVKDLNFTRAGGSDGERRAADYIRGKLKSFGYNVQEEKFHVLTYKVNENKIEVLEPDTKEVDCVGVGLSGLTSKDGIEGPLIYLENVNDFSVKNCKGAIALVNGWLQFDEFRLLAEQNPLAIILINTFPRRSLPRVCVPHEWNTDQKGIPIMFVTYEDAVQLLREKTSKVRVKLIQEAIPSESQNLIAEKIGEEYPDEHIMACAHYDSTRDSVGSCDNASGTAILLELARIFAEEKTKRSILFAFFGSEELWMRGSIEYVRRHSNMLRSIQLLVNIDVQGQLVGHLYSFITGSPGINDCLQSLALETGVHEQISGELGVSDCLPFNSKGIPSVWFTRMGGSAYFMHSPEDAIEHIGPAPLERTGKISEQLIRKLANSETLPFQRGIPDEKRTEVTSFLKNKIGVLT